MFPVPLPQRKSPRLAGYDYSAEGAYFVTACTHQRDHLFGDIRSGKMYLTELGKLVESCWAQIPEHHPNCELDAFVVMPNHFHGIIVIVDSVGTPYMASENSVKQKTDGMYPVPTDGNREPDVKRPTLGVIVGTFKAAVTRRANRTLKFAPKIWQARYHDHIIRNEREYDHIRAYVLDNPARWDDDVFNET